MTNAQTMRALESRIRRRVTEGRWDSVIGWSRIAASFAVTNPTGWLRSSALEASLARAADEIGPVRRSSRADVVHIASELHLLGGHRSMVGRWLAVDRLRGRRSDLVITRDHPVPHDIEAAVLATGGRIHRLTGMGQLARAIRLRSLAADMVVSHAHADDPVPAVAFGGGWPAREGVRVIHVDHADHLFAILPPVLDAYASLRGVGAVAAVEARGVPSGSLARLPIPVEAVESQRSASRSGCVTLLALARPLKFRGNALHPGFLDIVMPALHQVPGARLVVVGPEPDDPVFGAAIASGRVVVPGPTTRPQAWLDTADIHLDSIPFGSTTSMLESAARGTPVLSGTRHRGRAELLSSSGVLDHGVIEARDDETYAEALAWLVKDPGLRHQVGAAGARDVGLLNALESWVGSLDALDALDNPVVSAGAEPAHEPDYAEQLAAIQPPTPVEWIAMGAIGDLDARDRAGVRARTSVRRLSHRMRRHQPSLTRGIA